MKNEQFMNINNEKLSKILGEAIEASFTAEEMAEMGYTPKSPAKVTVATQSMTKIATTAENYSSLTPEEFYDKAIIRWSQTGTAQPKSKKNFLRATTRHALRESLKTRYSQREAIRGYYSCLLDVVCATNDWAMAASSPDEKPTFNMFGNYQLSGSVFDSKITITRKRLVKLLDELNSWLQILKLPVLTRKSVRYLIELILNDRLSPNLRKIATQYLSELNTSEKPKNIEQLIKCSIAA